MTTYLADTNVIVRWVLPQDPLCLPATTSVELLLRQGHAVYVSSQNLVEFWSVSTRPRSANGLGMTPAEAAAEPDRIEAFFPLLEDLPGIYGKWRQLVQTAGVAGRQAYDTRLVALMLLHTVTHILTFNTEDFRRYPRIVAVSPYDVLAAPTEASG